MKRMNAGDLRSFGIEFVGSLPWGTHLCQFYDTKDDLVEVLVPYFAEGLRGNEFCMWVTSPPLEVEQAREALRKEVPDLEAYFQKGQIEIISYSDWYLNQGHFDKEWVLNGWVRKEKEAIRRGFDGLRLTGNTFWVEKDLWKNFVEYEADINRTIVSHSMIALCTYCLGKCSGEDVIDVIRNHVGTLVKRGKEWVVVEDSVQRKETELFLKNTIQTSVDGFLIIDRKGRLLEVNDSYLKLMGYSREELLKMNIQDVEAKETKEETKKHMEEIGKQGNDRFETVHRRKDGTLIDFEVTVSHVHLEEGRFFVFLHDITKRKENVAKIAETVDTLSMALKAVGGATWDANLLEGGRIWSPENYELFGIDPATMVTQDFVLTLIHPEDRDKLARLVLGAHANHDEVWSHEFRIISPKRGLRWVATSAKTIYDEEGKPIRMIGVNFDITKQKQIEEEIRSLAKFPAENPNAVIRIGRDGKVLYCNSGGRFLLGEWKCKVGEQAPKDLSTLVEAALASKEQVEFEETHGAEVFSLLAVPVSEGGYVNIYGIDITKRKNAEANLKKSMEEARQRAEELEKLMDVIPNALWVSRDPECRVITGNSAANRFYEADEGQNVSAGSATGGGQDTTRRFFRDGVELVPEELPMQEAATKGVEIRNSELDVRLPSGNFITILGNASPLLNAEGKVRGCVASFLDITERKRTEQRLLQTLKESEQRQAEVAALLRASKSVLRDREFKISARAIFDSCKTLLGAAAGYTALLSDDGRDNIVLFLESGGSPCNVDPSLPMPIRGLRAETYNSGRVSIENDFNQSKWLDLLPFGHVTLQNVLFAPLTVNNRTVGVIGLANKPGGFTTHDAEMALAFGEIASISLVNSQMLEMIAENSRKLQLHSENLEALVEEKTVQLRNAERLAAIGQTAGMVGHDIRNPLQAIVGDIYLAKADLTSLPDSEEKASIQESLEAVEKNVLYINKIVADLQDFAKPLVPLVDEVDLRQVVDECVSNHGIPQNIRVSGQVEKDAEKAKLDSAFLKRILGNLVSNAVQAMPEGGSLDLHVYREAGEIVFKVSDTGVGVPEKVKSKLFTPLFTTKSKGQGFGLAVVKRLTEALNGTVTCESIEGKGSVFKVKFPLPQGNGS